MSGHQRGDVGGGVVGGVPAEDEAAAAQDGHLVRERLDLRQLVADEDDGQVAGHAPQQRDELVRLLRGERAGRLIEDEEARAEAERLDQLHALLLADGELPDVRVGIDRKAVVLGDGDDASAHGGQIELRGAPDPRAKALVLSLCLHLGQAQRDVLRHGEVGHEHVLLVYHADAAGERVAGGAEDDLPVVDEDFALVRRVQAHQDVHQGRLARAVLADERQHLALAHGERDVAAREDAGEALGDVLDAKAGDRLGCHGHTSVCGPAGRDQLLRRCAIFGTRREKRDCRTAQGGNGIPCCRLRQSRRITRERCR